MAAHDIDLAQAVHQRTVARSALWQTERRRRKSDALVVHPAGIDTGVRLVPHDSVSIDAAMIPARWDAVDDTRGGVVLANARGRTVRGATALLAALRVAGVDNAVVEYHGSGIPAEISDFCFYLEMLAEVGVRPQDAERRLLRAIDRVEVRDRSGYALLTPDDRFRASVQVTTIGRGGSAETTFATLFSGCDEPDAGFHATLLGSTAMQRIDPGDTRVARPLREICTWPEAVGAAAVGVIGHLALAGAPLAGHLGCHGSNPGLLQALLRAVMERRTVLPTTVSAHRARIRAAQAHHDFSPA